MPVSKSIEATRAEKKKRIEALVAHYKPLMWLSPQRIRLEFFNTRADYPNGEGMAAGCIGMPEYWSAAMNFTLDELEGDDIAQTVVHEMSHIILAPMSCLLDRLCNGNSERQESTRLAMENCTTHVERVLYAALPEMPTSAPTGTRRSPRPRSKPRTPR